MKYVKLFFGLFGVASIGLIIAGLVHHKDYGSIGMFALMMLVYALSYLEICLVKYREDLRDMLYITMGAASAKASFGFLWQYPL
jgi:hypothetical protein